MKQPIMNKLQITTDIARNDFLQILAMRKSAVSGQMSAVSCSRASRGFTLVETLIAISILLVSVVGPIGLIGDSIHRISYARDEMVAINLAQEGIEVVRQKRDSNKLSAAAQWNTGFNQPEYIVDVGSVAAPLNPITVDQRVYFDPTTKLYRQSIAIGYVPTVFSRKITTTTIVANEVKITSVVTWSTGGQAGSISASENLFNWIP